MKKFSIISLLLLLTVKVFSQADTSMPKPSIQTDYLKKSKNQKTTAWILLGTGTAMMVTGLIISGNAVEKDPIGVPFGANEDFNSGAVLVTVGVLADLASIPFFIAGAKNKGRAMAVTLRNDMVPQLQRNALARVPAPTVGLVFRF